MVSKEIVLETIKRMYSSGIDDETIKATLRDIGLDDKEAEQMIAEAQGKGKEAPRGSGGRGSGKGAGGGGRRTTAADDEEEEPEPEGAEGDEAGAEDGGGADEESADAEEEIQERIAAKAAEKIKRHLDDERADRAMRMSTAETMLEEQGEKIDGFGEGLRGLHEKMDAPRGDVVIQEPSVELRRVRERLDAIELQLSDLRAASSATQALLKKILETDRKVLAEMGGK
ncbi:MAG: hypothetical protein V1676_03730 [Candidatus Diapherotrites archaeon]